MVIVGIFAQILVGMALLIGGLIGLGFVVGPVIVGGRRSRDRRMACDPVDCATLGCPEGEACTVRRETMVPFVWSPPVVSRTEVLDAPSPQLQTIIAANLTAVCCRCARVVVLGDPRFTTHVLCDACKGGEHGRMDEYFAHRKGRDDG